MNGGHCTRVSKAERHSHSYQNTSLLGSSKNLHQHISPLCQDHCRIFENYIVRAKGVVCEQCFKKLSILRAGSASKTHSSSPAVRDSVGVASKLCTIRICGGGKSLRHMYWSKCVWNTLKYSHCMILNIPRLKGCTQANFHLRAGMSTFRGLIFLNKQQFQNYFQCLLPGVYW